MEIIRLLPGVDEHWKDMPEFLRRSRIFLERYLPETNPVPVIEDLKNRWLTSPFLTSFYLVKDDGGLPYAHMVSWLADALGQPPYVFVYQAHCDKFSKLGPVAEGVIKDVTEWVKVLNFAIKDGSKIHRLEMATWRKAEVWEAYFKKMGMTALKTRSVISVDLNLG